MKTTKSISTISYNSTSYLIGTLNDLVKSKKVTYWCFIYHKAEPTPDEAGLKAHHHVYIEPSKLIQTDDIVDALKEIDFNHPDKTLGCMPFRTTKRFGDWYLYALHDRRYLSLKNQSRHFHYTSDDIKTNNPEYLAYLVYNIDMSEISPYDVMYEYITKGILFTDYVRDMHISPLHASQYKKVWDYMISDTYCNRDMSLNNDADSIPEKFRPDTVDDGDIEDIFD